MEEWEREGTRGGRREKGGGRNLVYRGCDGGGDLWDARRALEEHDRVRVLMEGVHRQDHRLQSVLCTKYWTKSTNGRAKIPCEE